MGVRIGLLTAALVACLTACGGGGGGGAAVAAPNITSVTADRSSVALAWEQGATGTDVVVLLNASSTLPTPLFVGAGTPGGVADPNLGPIDVALPSVSRANVRISPRAGLAAGSYSGTVVLKACIDAACSQQYGGSPINVAYSFTVAPLEAGFDASPRILAIEGEAQQALAQLVQVALPAGVTSYTAKATDPATLIDAVTPTGFRVTVPARAVGSYSSTVEVLAGGLKRLVTVQHTATPRRLKLLRPSVTVGGGSAVANRFVLDVVQYAEGQATASVSNDGHPWLHAVPTTGGLVVTLDPVPSGRYVGSMTVSSGTDRVTVPVTYIVDKGVAAESSFAVGRPALALASTVGGAATSELLSVQRPTWSNRADLSLAYDNGAGWLSTSADLSGNLIFKADPAGMAAGVYRAVATVTSDWPSPPITVPVVFTVGDGMAVPAPQTVLMHSGSSATTLAGVVDVRDTRGQALAWTASSSAPWLRLAAASGAAGSLPQFSIDTALAAALPNFADAPGSLTITAQSASGAALAPVQASITLRRELAEVHSVGPLAAVLGQTREVIVRGRGFDRLAAAFGERGLLVNGVVPVALRLSNTTLKARMPDPGLSVTAGDFAVRALNKLGVATSTALLRLRPPHALPGAALATGGSVRTVLHDGLRQQLWVANTGLGAIQRWREVDGAWVADKLALADLFDIGMSPDGAWLLATERSGKLHLIDPVALTISHSYSAPGAFYPIPGSGHGIAITNDSRAWLTLTGGLGTANRMVTFDLRARSFSIEQPAGVASSFDGGPWYEASRNGERLLVVQGSVGNPPPPMLYVDMANGQWHPTPADLTFFYFSLNGLNDDAGHSVVLGNVFDAEFGFVGRPTIPDAGYSDSAAVLSPDGQRLYVYALPKDWQNSAATALPRVYVFSTVTNTTVAGLPLLGSVPVSDYPSCRLQTLSAECGRPVLNIAADGKTLFIGGDVKLLVLPLP